MWCNLWGECGVLVGEQGSVGRNIICGTRVLGCGWCSWGKMVKTGQNKGGGAGGKMRL